MTRLDLDPDNLALTLAQARKDLNQLKTRQFAGASDINIVINDSGNATDYHLTGTLAQQDALTIDFTSAVMNFAFVELFWKVFLDSPTAEIHPGDAHYPSYVGSQYYQFPKSISGTATDPSIIPTKTRFVFQHAGDSGHEYYYKFYVQATDKGSFVFS